MAGGTMPSGPMFPVRSVLIGTFVPTVLFEMGVGAVMPIIPAVLVLTPSIGLLPLSISST